MTKAQAPASILGLDVIDATISALHVADFNPRSITKQQFDQLQRSMQTDPEMLRARPLIALPDGTVVCGNMRLRAAEALGWQTIPTIYADLDEKRAREWMLRDNNTFGSFEDQDLAELLVGLQMDGSDLTLLGFPDDELTRLLESVGALGDTLLTDAESQGTPIEWASLADRFLVPPFSVLDARQGYWQARKRQWLALGIQSELGRGEQPGTSADARPGEEPTYRQIGSNNGLLGFSEQVRSHYRANATPSGAPRDAARLGPDGHTVRGDGRGQPLARTFGSGGPSDLHHQFNARPPHGPTVTQASDGTLQYRPTNQGDGTASGTSVFDPVLCELAYRWFCPPTGHVLDPFCGGSVRGIVAAKLGRQYTGLDLRPEQVQANAEQALTITPEALPRWLVGDSRDVATLAPGTYDLLFSCPPYADLERYSDDPRDLSTLDYPAFLAAYRAIIAASLGLLAADRFACWVVGDVRDPKGYYRNLVADTVAAFQDAGARLYNEAILVTALGSLPIRVGKQFESGRKLGKTHQQCLVFCKGDAWKATEACGPVEVVDLDVLLTEDAEWTVEADADA